MSHTEMVRTHALSQVYLGYSGAEEVWAVDQVEMAVERGEFVTLLGPSGAGKSALLRVLAGQERPSFGGAWVDGREVGALRGEALAEYRQRGVGYLPQRPALLADLTVLENVLLPMVPCGRQPYDVDKWARETLEELGLGGRLRAPAGCLSAGEAERVALARALVGRAPLLLLDEPAASLDRRTGGEAVGLLDRLNREEGLTVLLATRDADLAGLADRVLRMDRGQVLEGQGVRERAWAAA